MQRVINNQDYDQIVDSESQFLSNFSIGFALPIERGGARHDAELGGSGTLVSIDQAHGILTADHVVTLLRERENIGLILPDTNKQLHHISFKFSMSKSTALPDRGAEGVGPDLCFLVPPPDIVETLQARKSFYNLTRRRDAMLSHPSPIENGIWGLFGFAGELVSDGEAKQGFARVKIFRGGLSAGIISERYFIDRHDYMKFPALYNHLYDGPDSFGGFSGGGLWQILARHEDNRWEVTDRLLSGVAFYQSDKRETPDGIIRDVVCHGPTSVYGNLIDLIRGQ